MDKEELALLVQFVTGTSKVPLEGFKALQARAPPNTPRLPNEHFRLSVYRALSLPLRLFDSYLPVRRAHRDAFRMHCHVKDFGNCHNWGDLSFGSGNRGICWSLLGGWAVLAGHWWAAAFPDPQGVRAAGPPAQRAHLLQPAGPHRVSQPGAAARPPGTGTARGQRGLRLWVGFGVGAGACLDQLRQRVRVVGAGALSRSRVGLEPA